MWEGIDRCTLITLSTLDVLLVVPFDVPSCANPVATFMRCLSTNFLRVRSARTRFSFYFEYSIWSSVLMEISLASIAQPVPGDPGTRGGDSFAPGDGRMNSLWFT